VARLRRHLDRGLAELLPAGEPCALLDFPDHSNVGDSLIWLGQVSALRRRGVRIAYASDQRGFDAERLERFVPRGPILLSGGGNFGDVWEASQDFRERILRRFPERRVVQLPQSIWFGDPARRERARRALAAHERFTLLVRDDASRARAHDELGMEAPLWPDMAFGLSPLPRRPAPEVDLVWLGRADEETRAGAHTPEGVTRSDWVVGGRELPDRLRKRLRKRVRGRGPVPDLLQRALQRTLEPAARRQLRRGVRMLGRGRVVVSDRLHAHILCVLLGIPHVVLDNSYGKVHDFHRTWTSGSAVAHRAGSPSEALAIARRLAR